MVRRPTKPIATTLLYVLVAPKPLVRSYPAKASWEESFVVQAVLVLESVVRLVVTYR